MSDFHYDKHGVLRRTYCNRFEQYSVFLAVLCSRSQFCVVPRVYHARVRRPENQL